MAAKSIGCRSSANSHGPLDSDFLSGPIYPRQEIPRDQELDSDETDATQLVDNVL